MRTGIYQGNLPRKSVTPFFIRVQEMESPILFLGSNKRYYAI